MINVLMLVLAAQGNATLTRGQSLTVPPPMGPFVGVYMSCISNRISADNRMPASMDIARLVYADAKSACAQIRKSAAEDAEKALSAFATYGGRSQRKELVEQTLLASEGTFESLFNIPLPPPPGGANGKGSSKHNAPDQ